MPSSSFSDGSQMSSNVIRRRGRQAVVPLLQEYGLFSVSGSLISVIERLSVISMTSQSTISDGEELLDLESIVFAPVRIHQQNTGENDTQLAERVRNMDDTLELVTSSPVMPDAEEQQAETSFAP